MCFLESHREELKAHNRATRSCEDLMKQSQHIEKVFKNESSKKTKTNLRLKALIAIARWLAFQASAFRGHDEFMILKTMAT